MCSSYITISLDNAIWGGEQDPVEASMSQGTGLHFVPNKAPLHSLAKSQSCTLTDSVIFVEFNVSFAKQYNFYTVHTHPVVQKGL